MSVAAVLYLLGFVQLGFAIILPPGYQFNAQPGVGTVFMSRRACSAADDDCRVQRLITSTDGSNPLFCEASVDGPQGRATEDVFGTNADFTKTQCREASDYEIVRMWAAKDVSITVVGFDKEGKATWRALADDESSWIDITKFMTGTTTGEEDYQIFQRPPELVRAVPRSTLDSLEYASEWSLGDVYRYVMKSEETPGMALIFTIEHPDFDSVLCVVSYSGKKGQDPGKMSFFDKPCEGSKWGVSWGYNAEAEEDVAVMTLTNEKRDRRAFFGFRYVNDNTRLGDRGPEKTEKY